MRIVQLANFYSPTSGGLRTAVDAVGRGYVERGHERVLVVPGPEDDEVVTSSGRRIHVRGPRLPGRSGYRLVLDRRRVAAVLEELAPDRVEVSDKLTLGFVGAWAEARSVPSVLWSHERSDAILERRVLPRRLLRAATAWRSEQLGASFTTVVCSSAFAAAEFRVRGIDAVVVPLGVDLDRCAPADDRPADERIHLVTVGRLSSEKRVDLAVATLRVLVEAGVDAHLTIVGDGPCRAALERAAHGLPVAFLGHVADRATLAWLVAEATVALQPCPIEAFGLAVLEALACGTPVVVPDTGAARELLVGGAGLAVPAAPAALAAAVRSVASGDRGRARQLCRSRAEWFPWAVTVDGMLAAHGLLPAGVG